MNENKHSLSRFKPILYIQDDTILRRFFEVREVFLEITVSIVECPGVESIKGEGNN